LKTSQNDSSFLCIYISVLKNIKWNQGKMKQKLTYKSQLKGIQIEQTEESYTSKIRPFCGGRHKMDEFLNVLFIKQKSIVM
ncbi:zinc ribbon domain-containing protein, partial [Bacillus cereus]|uniref:zinc ribbon domain-containing protein n=1 Tax=Bacillus cereus TaxID=1396 RepID=UPI00398127CE